VVFYDQRSVPEGGRQLGGHLTGRAGADDDQVVDVVHFCQIPA
jgi:hypothetical protein